MSENPLLDIISAIKDLSESDEYEDSGHSSNPQSRCWGFRKPDVDSIGYAGTNTNDSGYKSFCATPDVPEYADYDLQKVKEIPHDCSSEEQILKLRNALECALSRYKPKVCEKNNYLRHRKCYCSVSCHVCQPKPQIDCCSSTQRTIKIDSAHADIAKPSDIYGMTSVSEQLDMILYRLSPEMPSSSVAEKTSNKSSQPAFVTNHEPDTSNSNPPQPPSIRSKVKCFKTASNSSADTSDYHLYEEIVYELMTSNSKSEPDEPPPLPERPKALKNSKQKKRNKLFQFIQKRKQPPSNANVDDDYGFCSTAKK